MTAPSASSRARRWCATRPAWAPPSGARRATRPAWSSRAPLALPHSQVVSFDGSVKDAVARLEDQPGVVDAQPNYIYHALAAAPNDTFFGHLWGLGGTPGVDVLPAWDRTPRRRPGDRRRGHRRGPDATPTCGEPGGQGHDFVDNDDEPDDFNLHGTHVAGTAAGDRRQRPGRRRRGAAGEDHAGPGARRGGQGQQREHRERHRCSPREQRRHGDQPEPRRARRRRRRGPGRGDRAGRASTTSWSCRPPATRTTTTTSTRRRRARSTRRRTTSSASRR